MANYSTKSFSEWADRVPTSSSRATRTFWERHPDAFPHAVQVAGFAMGLFLGGFHVAGRLPVTGRLGSGWELTAFAAFGAMSGFSLASLALVATLSTHERAKEVIDENPGRRLLGALVHSTWGWICPALMALVVLVLPSGWPRTWGEGLLLLLVAIGAAQAMLALYALTLFFSRFTRLKAP
jgi:hypothetical protein